MHIALKGAIAGMTASAAIGLASPSFAGCADGSIKPASWTGNAGDLHQRVDYNNERPIVGLWSISLVSGGAQVDWGYSEWHSDGTEIMNSGGHTPASGNFCLGVWRQTGPNAYHLKHFPLAYNPSTGQLAAKIILTEDVSVDHGGMNFAGSFTQDVYDPTGTNLMQHIAGTITGRRVTPN